MLTGYGDPPETAQSRDTTPLTAQPVLRPRPSERDRTAEAPRDLVAPYERMN